MHASKVYSPVFKALSKAELMADELDKTTT